MSAADFVDNTDFFMHNLLEPKNKPGPFFMEFWQYLNVCIFYEMDYDCCVDTVGVPLNEAFLHSKIVILD